MTRTRVAMRATQLVVAVFIGTIPLTSPTHAESKLPPCPSDPTELWTNCFGSRTFANGGQYVGEYKNDKADGEGNYTWPDGQTYTGHWTDDLRNGRGTTVYPSGEQYSGDYRADKRNGEGTFTWPDGQKYVGHWANDRQNGFGTQYAADGSVNQSGMWANGQYAQVILTAKPGAAAAPVSAHAEVGLVKEGTAFKVPVMLSDSVTVNFGLDADSSTVTLPLETVRALIQAGRLRKEDFSDAKSYTLPDGSSLPGKSFRIRSLRVGDRVLENINGTVADGDNPPVLGQSFISRFGHVAFDLKRQVLVLE